jgi:hypothetical protein
MIGTPFPGYEVVPNGAKVGLIIVHGIAEHDDASRTALFDLMTGWILERA